MSGWGGTTKMTTQHACLLFFRNIRRSAPLAQGRAWTPPSLSQRRGPQGCKREELEILLNLILLLCISSSHLLKMYYLCTKWGFQGGTSGKKPACQYRRHKGLGFHPWIGEDPLEEEMATHSSILVWRIPLTEEPGRLQSIGPQRVGHD